MNEGSIFTLFLFLNALPLAVFRFFPTMDGASHLYNSNIILELLSHNHIFQSFFDLNPELVPNWTGHFILTLFNSFLPAWMAEKLLLILYAILLPLSFRYLIHIVNPENKILSLMALPFVYTFVFGLGYYNFSLSLIVLFFSLAVYFKYRDISRVKFTLLFLGLFLLTYLSHLFFVVLLLALLLGIEVWRYFSVWATSGQNDYKTFLINVAFVLIAALPVILLTYNYLSNHASGDAADSTSGVKESIKYLAIARPFVIYSFDWEQGFTILISIGMWFLFVLGTLLIIRKNGLWFFLKEKAIWFWLVVIFVLTYLFIPNSMGGAGNMQNRILIVVFTMLILFAAFMSFPKWLQSISVIFIVTGQLLLVNYYVQVIRDLNPMAKQIEASAKYVDKNSVVLPVNHSSNWLMLHFGNYLAIEKPIIVLDNYEADVRYFPVIWKDYNRPEMGLENEQIEYILVYGNNAEKQAKLNEQFGSDFKLHHKSKLVKLYKRSER
jgi:hypothetical protein